MTEINDSLQNVNDNLTQALTGLQSARRTSDSSRFLTEAHYNDLYNKVRIFQNIVNLVPEDANIDYPTIVDKEGNELPEVLEELKEVRASGEPLEPIDIKGAITLAGVYGKLYGDGFIFLGVKDGLDTTEPLDWSRVKGLDWVIVRNKYEVSLNYQNETITSYPTGLNIFNNPEQNAISGTKFHVSRVIRMHGVSVHGTTYQKDGFNSSVIDAVYDDYKRYLEAIQAGSEMLKSHSIFKFGMKGLSAKALKSNVLGNLKNRFNNILQSIDVLGGVMYDLDNESADYVNRNYGGAKDLLEHLKDWLVGNTGLPRNKVFGSAASGGMSEQSEGEERQWNEIINRYRSLQVTPAYEVLINLILVSKGLKKGDAHPVFKPFHQMTQEAEATIKQQKATTLKQKADAIVVLQATGLYSDEEIKEIVELS